MSWEAGSLFVCMYTEDRGGVCQRSMKCNMRGVCWGSEILEIVHMYLKDGPKLS